MKNKKLFITGIVIFSAIVVIATFLLLWYWGDTYPQFDGTFDAAFAIPGLADGATPQGMTNWKTDAFKVETENEDGSKSTENFAGDEYFFISSYFKNAPSRIYVVGKETGYAGYVTVKNVHEDGKEDTYYDGHCGGIATNGYFMWICSNEGDTGYVYCAKTADKTYNYQIGREIIAKAHQNGEIQFNSKFNANCKASFLYYYGDGRYTESYNLLQGDKLYVGEFERGNGYKTDDNHKGKTPAGDYNTAFVYEYSVNTSTTMTSESNITGLVCIDDYNTVTPKIHKSFLHRVPQVQNIYSITGEIQGFARIHNTKTNNSGTTELDDKLVLSQSYGLKNSKLYYYDWTEITKNDSGNYKTYRNFNKDEKYFEYEGVKTSSGAPANEDNLGQTSLRVYFVDSDNLLNEYSVPSMSEGLCVSGNRVYVLFESGANKYKLFVRRVLNEVYSFVPRENLSGK